MGNAFNGEHQGPWKWQFMNDNQQFEDFTDSTSQIVERSFAKGLTFGTFHVGNIAKSSKVQYQVNFKTMIQKNLTSNRIRTIRRVPISVKGAVPVSSSKMTVDYMKWQFYDKHGIWTDYPVANSKQLNELLRNTVQPIYYHSNLNAPFSRNSTLTVRMKNNENGKWYIYDIDVLALKQRNQSTQKLRDIRQIPVYSKGRRGLDLNGKRENRSNKKIRNRWEWMDDDGTFKKYDDETSAQIEVAQTEKWKKYYFVSGSNGNSYEIHFNSMIQYNIKSGKQRRVRRIASKSKPKMKGIGPNPTTWTGPTGGDRRVFGQKVMDLYCVIGKETAKEVKQCGRLIRGTLGPFGSGLYFYDSEEIAVFMAKHRNEENRGRVVMAKVFVGEMIDVSNQDDKQFDFRTLQQSGKDSVSRTLGFGNEFIVYNADQVCVVKLEKY